jgi:chromosome segregation protein
MYLKRLQVQGFKTFAQKTDLSFDSGITAIIGPNGSGKSNIADAIRWVLGEQRYSALRCKKTEDVIFAGSALKPGMGFSEAHITFDNTDKLLPIDFSEVTLTRRAYRTGENEYFINKSKVRLKDIDELLSGLSRTYLSITQGMVDAVLSQKPEERRGLFEDAASIGQYNLKKTEAEDRLSKTEENARRVADILAEISPRLKGLERSAKQAEEFYSLQEELQNLLKRWYGHKWQLGQNNLELAKGDEAEKLKRLVAVRSEMEQLQDELSRSRSRQNDKRADLAELHRDSSHLHNRAQELQQQIAVDQERLNGLQRQYETQRSEIATLDVALENNANRLIELEKEHQAVLVEQSNEQKTLSDQESALKAKAQETRQAEANLTKQREDLINLNNRLETFKMQFNEFAERRKALAQQDAQFQQSRNLTLAKQGELEQEIADCLTKVSGFEAEANKLKERIKENERENSTTQDALRQTERSLQEFRSKREANRSRLDLLQKLQSNFAGLYGGVKAVMHAKGKLRGILGLVANLAEVPAEYEMAIEVALGGHLQDVVVESWDAAEAAIGFLKQNGAGRATFLPLDSLRGGGTTDLKLKNSGVRGIASDLIRFAPQFRPVYQQLLSRVLVVEDLTVARQVLRELPGGWSAVTLGGEIVRSTGIVTGGSSGKDKDRAEGSVLGRERELRELPQTIAKLEQSIRDTGGEVATLQAKVEACRQKAVELERQNQQLNRTQQQTREKLAGLRAQFDRLSDELRLREESRQNIARELANLDGREQTLKQERTSLEQNRLTFQEQIKELERAWRSAQANENDEREKLAALKTATAIAAQRLKNSEVNLRLAGDEKNRLTGQIQQRKSNLALLEQQSATLQKRLESAQSESATLAEQLEQLRKDIVPLEKELLELERDQLEGERLWSEQGNRLLSVETAYNRAAVEVQRIVGELDTLQVQAEADLAPSTGGLEGVRLEDAFDWQSSKVLSETEAGQLQRQIEQSRAKLRRIGIVNPLALQEYRETRERYLFMTGQLTDLESTANSLRLLIEKLDRVTQDMFAKTFEQVAEHFRKYFGLLFNGGTAKLMLTTPDNLAETGIEILAQPPGKRQQNLTLLSGGERSLTAIALLFALLEVNPTPFCVLDEVDAALDEANVGRFCDTLKRLSDRTQFIVITHNRGTIESARTIYGVSMGAESISRVLSLRVEEALKFRQKTRSNGHAPAVIAGV